MWSCMDLPAFIGWRLQPQGRAPTGHPVTLEPAAYSAAFHLPMPPSPIDPNGFSRVCVARDWMPLRSLRSAAHCVQPVAFFRCYWRLDPVLLPCGSIRGSVSFCVFSCKKMWHIFISACCPNHFGRDFHRRVSDLLFFWAQWGFVQFHSFRSVVITSYPNTHQNMNSVVSFLFCPRIQGAGRPHGPVRAIRGTARRERQGPEGWGPAGLLFQSNTKGGIGWACFFPTDFCPLTVQGAVNIFVSVFYLQFFSGSGPTAPAEWEWGIRLGSD